jgi:3-hydroxymyristoyl/3-hydroxydecanoyl-(acyl carrier protein) dehydratase
MNYLEILKDARLNTAFSLSSKLDIFAHHFPGSPLLPGALSGVLLTENCGGPGWSLKKISGLRFRKPLTPELPITMACIVKHESPLEKVCAGKIQSGSDTIADGEFTFTKAELARVNGAKPEPAKCSWTLSQIHEYLPHGKPIVLVDQLIEASYPSEIQDALAGNGAVSLDQAKLVGTKIHARSKLKSDNFWLHCQILPSPILSELVAQVGALTLAPFFTGKKPQVSLLGCDTEYFAVASDGATIDTYVELTRVKRLGSESNMIIFKGQCYVGDTEIAQVNLNAMASF